MRRVFLNIAAAALTFAVGLGLAALPGPAGRSGGVREASPLNDTPVHVGDSRGGRETYGEAQTPEDFKQFWAEFRSAVAREDSEGLYDLTAHEGFYWRRAGLTLESEPCEDSSVSFEPPGYVAAVTGCVFFIKDREEFSRNCPVIFRRTLRRAVLTREPIQNWPDSYILNVPAEGRRGAAELTVVFVDDGRGFKFAGEWR